MDIFYDIVPGNEGVGFEFHVIGDLTMKWYGNWLPVFIPCPILVRLITNGLWFGAVRARMIKYPRQLFASVKHTSVFQGEKKLTHLLFNSLSAVITIPMSKLEEKNIVSLPTYICACVFCVGHKGIHRRDPVEMVF